MKTDACSLCGVSEGPHQRAESCSEINHKFSSDGQLASVEQKPAPKQDRVVAAADPVLRLVLIRKGLVTLEDLAEVEEELYARQRVPERP